MRVEPFPEVALAEWMAARREPGPALPRLRTTNVRVYPGPRVAETWAVAEPAGKATAAETPPTKTAAPAIRGMNRPARIVRIFMKATCMARENIISPTSVIFGEEDLQNLREYTQLNTAVNLEDNFARHTLCNLRKKSVLMSHVAIS